MDWSKLITPNPNQAWYLVSAEMSKQIFGSDMTVVRRLEQAPWFDLLTCFSKSGYLTCTERMNKFFTKDYNFYLHGHIMDFVLVNSNTQYSRHSKDDLKGLIRICNPGIDQGAEMFLTGFRNEGVRIVCQNNICTLNNPTIHILKDEKKEISYVSRNLAAEAQNVWRDPIGRKEIRIRLRGITKESTEWSEWPETDFLFNTEIEIMKKRHVKYLYVITDCTYASKIEIEVSVDGWMRSDEVKGKIPVAFSCTKFPIDEKGFLMRTAVPKTTKTSSSFRPAPVNYYYSDTD